MDGFATIRDWLVPMLPQNPDISSAAVYWQAWSHKSKLKRCICNKKICLTGSKEASGVEFRTHFWQSKINMLLEDRLMEFYKSTWRETRETISDQECIFSFYRITCLFTSEKPEKRILQWYGDGINLFTHTLYTHMGTKMAGVCSELVLLFHQWTTYVLIITHSVSKRMNSMFRVQKSRELTLQ